MKVYVVTRIRDGRKSVRLTPVRKSKREGPDATYTQVAAELPDADARRIVDWVAKRDAK
jgi:hypothetical protein